MQLKGLSQVCPLLATVTPHSSPLTNIANFLCLICGRRAVVRLTLVAVTSYACLESLVDCDPPEETQELPVKYTHSSTHTRHTSHHRHFTGPNNELQFVLASDGVKYGFRNYRD